MNNRLKIYIGVLVLLVLVALVMEVSKPTPVDWRPTFNERHSKPYGLSVLHNELPGLFEGDEVTDMDVTPYEFFDTRYNRYDSVYTVSGNYISIGDRNVPDEQSAEELLYFASHGNHIFMSGTDFPVIFKDSLGFELDYGYFFERNTRLTLANPALARDSITFEKGARQVYFKELDPDKTTVLGYQRALDGNALQGGVYTERINFVKIDYGDGAFYLHTQPYLFTNYHLLRGNRHRYVQGLLSYLPAETVFFDSVNKIGSTLGYSPLRFVFSQPALRWAWYIGLLLLLTFLMFNARRRQRVVRVIRPLPNTTVDFARTVATLYYETKDHTGLIQKKITYFLEKIRSDYYLDTEVLGEKFAKNLALKSGKRKGLVIKLVRHIVFLRGKREHTETQLIELNKQIEAFYKN